MGRGAPFTIKVEDPHKYLLLTKQWGVAIGFYERWMLLLHSPTHTPTHEEIRRRLKQEGDDPSKYSPVTRKPARWARWDNYSLRVYWSLKETKVCIETMPDPLRYPLGLLTARLLPTTARRYEEFDGRLEYTLFWIQLA